MRTYKLFIVALALAPVFVLAQSGPAAPSAGITPESPLYFFDQLAETLQELFTFSPEGKAHLQITFAAERIAEVKIIMETKGVDAPGIDVARKRLQGHLQGATDVLLSEKSKGNDVSALAGELDDELADSKSVLEQAFEDEKNTLEDGLETLKKRYEAAKRSGNTTEATALSDEIAATKAEMKLLETKKEELDDDIAEEEDEFEKTRDEKSADRQKEATKQIAEAEKKQQELMSETRAEGTSIDPNAFEKFNRLLAQAKELFEKGNYQGAIELAKQAKASLESVKKDAESSRESGNQDAEQIKKAGEDATEEQKKEVETQSEAQKKAEEAAKKAAEEAAEALKKSQEAQQQ